MNELKLFYNRHRKKIWLAVLIIASLLAIVYVLNYFLTGNNDDKKNMDIVNQEEVLSDIRNSSNVDLSSTESAVSGSNVNSDILRSATEAIGKFFEYCRNGNIEEAYNMLTDECKEEMYNSQEDFKKWYVDDLYSGEEVDYEIQNWIGNTYKIDFAVGNMLATGNPNDVVTKQDYITVVKKDNNEYKLNINDYIGRNEVNKEKEQDNIKITVLNKNTYMDNEIYQIKVENNSDKDILLANLNKTDEIYIEDSNGVKYFAYTQELTEPEMIINSGDNRTINIKFYSSYVSTKYIERLVFSNAITNYNTETGLKTGETTEIIVNI